MSLAMPIPFAVQQVGEAVKATRDAAKALAVQRRPRPRLPHCRPAPTIRT